VDGACYDASPCAPLATPALAAPSPHHTRSVIIRSVHNAHCSTRALCCVHAALRLHAHALLLLHASDHACNAPATRP
jgi:hypothetical protein